MTIPDYFPANLRRSMASCDGFSISLLLDLQKNFTVKQNNKNNRVRPDPIIVTRLTHEIDNKWLFTWQAQGYVGYRFSKLFQTSVGYRAIGVDFDNGSGAERFRYDIISFGPNIQFGFNL